jgi:Zn-dependent peptidase ImmA (M78 family)
MQGSEGIGRRLAAARARAGLSLRDLAGAMDSRVSAQAIGKYERGAMRPRPPVLRALSRALRVPEDYLLGGGTIALAAVEFRKNRLTSRSEDASIRRQVLAAAERYLEVEDLLGGGAVREASTADLLLAVHSVEAAEEAAGRLRAAWRLGAGVLPHIADLLEERGIKVITLDLPASISGVACRAWRQHGAPVPVIVINRADTGERQRLTLAHELGHLLLAPVRAEIAEKAAFRFGAALLMPAELVRAEVGGKRRAVSLVELLQLKRLFGTSVQAIAYRLRDLGIVSVAAYRRMFDRFEQLGWMRPPYPEPYPMPKVEAGRFERLCFRALAEDVVSEADAARLLDMTVARLRRALREPPRRG